MGTPQTTRKYLCNRGHNFKIIPYPPLRHFPMIGIVQPQERSPSDFIFAPPFYGQAPSCPASATENQNLSLSPLSPLGGVALALAPTQPTLHSHMQGIPRATARETGNASPGHGSVHDSGSTRAAPGSKLEGKGLCGVRELPRAP